MFVLSDGDSVFISEENLDKKMKHISTEGKTYEAVVDEHEDNPNESIEYLGFK